MILDEERSAGILARFKKKEPLNLSVVKVEAPWLLEGLFNPENFRGWRESIEMAGVSIDKIRIEPFPEAICEECGFRGDILWMHIKHAHGMDSAEYVNVHPGAETASEAHRARMMANRHGRPAKAIIPHWEPAWSREYALDRIHEFSRQGIPLHYGHLAKNEPGLPAYVRRIYPSWDAGLAAAGLEVANVRLAKVAILLSADEVIKLLREKERTKPSELHVRASRHGQSRTLIRAAFRNFGAYEKALVVAGIDPVNKLPALKNPSKVRAREKLILETMENLKNPSPYLPANAKKYIARHSSAISNFYGNWTNFAISLKRVDRELFNSPGHRAYDSKKACIAALQERAKVGLSLRQEDVRTDNPSLEIMGEKHFENYSKALEAANVQRLPPSYDLRTYANGDEVIAAIRRRHQNGGSLYYSDLHPKSGDRGLLKWGSHYFGSFSKALAAAGVPHPGIKPTLRGRHPAAGSKLRD